VAAAGRADVGALQALPLVAARVEVHVLQQTPVRGLEGGPRGDIGADLRSAVGEAVPQLLQLRQPQQAGTRAQVVSRAGDPGANPARGYGRGQLALQAGDLLLQAPPGRTLVDRDGERLGRERRGGDGTIEDGGHSQPPMGARGFAPQKTCVPNIPMRCTRTMLSTIDFAVAVPTPTGPPLAL
jgi:hypothetical protein